MSVDFTQNTYLQSSVYEIQLDNRTGQLGSLFTIGNDVTIYADNTNTLTTPIIVGTIEDIHFSGDDELAPSETLVITGRNYISAMYDGIIAPVSYTSKDVAFIFKDLLARECPALDVTALPALIGVIVPFVQFANTAVFDAAQDLMSFAGGNWYFYVDANKKVQLKRIGASVSSTGNLSLISGFNVINVDVQTSNRNLYNQIWVYGDRSLSAAPRKTFTANGGSVYTLDYLPSNTAVFLSGTVPVNLVGGVLNFVGQGDPGSPYQYLVDYNNMNVVFVSGTNAGMNIPASGTSSTFYVDYQKSTPIVYYAQDPVSIALYKAREKIIVDKTIKDPRQAKITALSRLQQEAYPPTQIIGQYKGWANVTPGQSAGAYLPFQGISGNGLPVLSAKYVFTSDTNLSDTTLTLTLNHLVADGIDFLKKQIAEIQALKAADTISTNLYTYGQSSTGSAGVQVKSLSVNTRTLGSSFVLGHPVLGLLGVQSIQPILGAATLGPWTPQRSGGQFTTTFPWTWAHNWNNGNPLG